MESLTKVCTKCGIEKPLEEYNMHRAYKAQRRHACKVCVRAYTNQWYQDKKATDPEYFNKRFKSGRNYKLTLDEYNARIARGCVICGKRKGKLYVDHDHSCCSGIKTCGKCVRDVLCVRCNFIVGAIETVDVPTYVAYLEKWKHVSKL